jgi:oxygen-independent coproporphyrinogen-3 oxidase
VFRAYVTGPEERLIREFILQLKLGGARPSHYQQKFGVDVRERFAPQLGWLVGEGFASVNGDAITLTRDGLLQVDRLLHDFFLPHHRGGRYT